MYKILAIDDEPSFLLSLSNLLAYKNYSVTSLSNPLKTMAVLSGDNFDCILLDVWMPGIEGLQVLDEIKNKYPAIPVIMISGKSSISLAIESIKKGAYDFIEKPLDADRLLIALRNALEKRIWSDEKRSLISQLGETYQIIGKSQPIQKVFEKIDQIAITSAKVCITGESGTGKELVARAIHMHSPRSGKPFVKLNCAAIPAELLESQLFGHRKGAFTGAIRDQEGKFITAEGGSIFLDEIGDMNIQLQAKILNVLQDSEVEVIGDSTTRKIDVRIISATNKDLLQLVKEGKFREDLYHRLNVVQVNVPTLRERLEDVPALARHFLRLFAETNNKTLSDFTTPALSLLMQHDWPGNIRQLRNIVEKIAIFATSPIIQAEDVIDAIKSDPLLSIENNGPITLMSLEEARDNFERNYINQCLILTGRKVIECSKLLHVHRSALYKKMHKYNITHVGTGYEHHE